MKENSQNEVIYSNPNYDYSKVTPKPWLQDLIDDGVVVQYDDVKNRTQKYLDSINMTGDEFSKKYSKNLS